MSFLCISFCEIFAGHTSSYFIHSFLGFPFLLLLSTFHPSINFGVQLLSTSSNVQTISIVFLIFLNVLDIYNFYNFRFISSLSISLLPSARYQYMCPIIYLIGVHLCPALYSIKHDKFYQWFKDHSVCNSEIHCYIHKGSQIIPILSRTNPIFRIDAYFV